MKQNLVFIGAKYYRYVDGNIEIFRPLEIVNYDPKLGDGCTVRCWDEINNELHYMTCKILKETTAYLLPNMMIKIYIRGNTGIYMTMNTLDAQLSKASDKIEVCIYQDDYLHERWNTFLTNSAGGNFDPSKLKDITDEFTIYAYIDDKDDDIMNIISKSNMLDKINEAIDNYEAAADMLVAPEPRYTSIVSLFVQSAFTQKCREVLGVKSIHNNLFNEVEYLKPGDKLDLNTDQIMYIENYLMCYLSDVIAFKYSPFIDFDDIAKLDNNHILFMNLNGDLIYVSYNVEKKYEIDQDIAESMGVI